MKRGRARQQVKRQRWIGRSIANARASGREEYLTRTRRAVADGRIERSVERTRTPWIGQARSLASTGVSSPSVSSGRGEAGEPLPDQEQSGPTSQGDGAGITSSIIPRIAQATARR